jgi:hypothetical protein
MALPAHKEARRKGNLGRWDRSFFDDPSEFDGKEGYKSCKNSLKNMSSPKNKAPKELHYGSSP